MYPNIMAEMARNGLTREELAQKLNVNRRTVYNWLTNGKIPEDKALEMAKMFGVTVSYLIQR